MGNWFIAGLFYVAMLVVSLILMQYLPADSVWQQEGMGWVRVWLLPSFNGIIIYCVALWFKTSLDVRDEQKRK